MSCSIQTVEALCELIGRGDEADRCHAIRALGALRAESAVEQLIPYLRDEDIDVCVDTADTLGRIRSSEAVAALIESLNNEADGEICTSITEALGNIGGEAAIQTLQKLINERPEGMEWESDWDPWWNVQLEAVKALGKLRAECVVDDLLRIMDDETEQDIESEILHALALIPDGGIEALIGRLQNTELRTQSRARAARALRHAEPDKAVRVLGRALQDSAPEVRCEAAAALAALNASQYLRALLLMLRDPNEQVRDAAIKAVLELGGQADEIEGLQDALLPLLQDPGSQVRRTLMNALIATVASNPLSEQNLEAVIYNLQDADAETATAAAALLSHNGDRAAEPALLLILQNRTGHPMVRREAALALGRCGCLTDATLEALTQTVGDQQQPVRLAALSALMDLDRLTPTVAAGDEEPASPLQIIIAAVNGEIALAPDRDAIIEKLQQNATAETDPTTAVETARAAPEIDPPPIPADYNPDAVSATTTDSPATDGPLEPLPEVLADYIQPPRTDQPALPEQAGRIVQPGEIRRAMSTLDAIAMDNVENALGLSAPAAEIEPDNETREYMAVVDENINTMKRLRSQRHITPEQDVRRLGARILAQSERPEAVTALVQALNEEDHLLRREAADAIGLIGQRNPALPALMDAVGTLITQLAVGDMEQRVTCARALGNLGNRAALIPLLETLDDADSNVQVQAIGALAQLTVHGADPAQADHMVVRNIPPRSVARRLLQQLGNPVMAVRVATARALAEIVSRESDQTFSRSVAAQIIDSIAEWSGEEARPLGQVLQQFDIPFCTERLLGLLQQADSSLKRSVYIEMLEALLNRNSQQARQAA